MSRRGSAAWVLLIGSARYLFLVGEWVWPWLRAPLPARRWRKVVTAVQGVVLTVAAAGVLPRGLMQGLLVAALVALAVSFGECVVWLWRRRDAAAPRRPDARNRRDPSRRPCAGRCGGGWRWRSRSSPLVFVWAALVLPDQTVVFAVGEFVRLPLEILVVIAVGALLPVTPRRVLAVLAGRAARGARVRPGPRRRVHHRL